MTSKLFVLSIAVGLSITLVARPQQVPKKGSYVLNDSPAQITVEYHTLTGWQSLKLEPGKDGRVEGDRARITSQRDDKAVITVDCPLIVGQKYRLFWNTQTNMWDIVRVVP